MPCLLRLRGGRWLAVVLTAQLPAAPGPSAGKEPNVTLSEEDGRIDGRGVWVPPNNPGFDWAERWPEREAWSVGSQVSRVGAGGTATLWECAASAQQSQSERRAGGFVPLAFGIDRLKHW